MKKCIANGCLVQYSYVDYLYHINIRVHSETHRDVKSNNGFRVTVRCIILNWDIILVWNVMLPFNICNNLSSYLVMKCTAITFFAKHNSHVDYLYHVNIRVHTVKLIATLSQTMASVWQCAITFRDKISLWSEMSFAPSISSNKAHTLRDEMCN